MGIKRAGRRVAVLVKIVHRNPCAVYTSVYTHNMTNTKNHRWITFHTDSKGRAYATYAFQGRNFRTSLVEAQANVALGIWTEEAAV